MKIYNVKTYLILSDSGYFIDKYGTPCPLIIIEDTDEAVFGESWKTRDGNPACIQYAVRRGFTKAIQGDGKVYYGKINGLGELVHETELIER